MQATTGFAFELDLVVCVLAIALLAVPYDAVALTDADEPDGGVVVGDYVGGYGENVSDRLFVERGGTPVRLATREDRLEADLG